MEEGSMRMAILTHTAGGTTLLHRKRSHVLGQSHRSGETPAAFG